jgi:hypothetical protein
MTRPKQPSCTPIIMCARCRSKPVSFSPLRTSNHPVDGYDEITPQQRLAADLLPYNHTHVNHPCAIWVRSGDENSRL